MIEKVRSYMKKYGMFPESGNIVAGISGGADSVCLLRVLVELREQSGFRLTAVHVNHRIRKEAGQDAEFVRELCHKWEVPFVLVEEDVEALAAAGHLSCEEAGRKVRYEAFERALEQMPGSGLDGCIAVAHNSDDRAETLLFHMFRGTGLNGMGSIRPVRSTKRGYRIIRPLLFARRCEIEEFLKEEGIAWCTDSTNSGELYTRNRIRNRILPYAEQYVSERARDHLAREAQLLAETSDFVGRMTVQAMERCCLRQSDGSLVFEVDAFGREDIFLQKQMILQAMLEVGTGRDLTAAHVEQACRLFEPGCQSGKKMEVAACRVNVCRQFGNVAVRRLKENEPEKATEVLLREGRQFVPGLGEIEAIVMEKSLLAERVNSTFLQDIPEKTYTKWLDYDKITEPAMFRTRRTGDYLTINSAGARKSLKRYLIEEKIPANRRDELVFLADGTHVIWVPGYRISAAYKITEQTKRVLQICFTGGNEDGREN